MAAAAARLPLIYYSCVRSLSERTMHLIRTHYIATYHSHLICSVCVCVCRLYVCVRVIFFVAVILSFARLDAYVFRVEFFIFLVQ